MSDRRRSAATAALGYGLVAAGGTVRGSAIDDAHTLLRAPRRFVPPSQAVYRARKLPGGRVLAHRWGVGTALVTLGAPAAAKGTAELVRHRRTTTAKRDRGFVAEGVQGTAQAWQDKAHGFQSGAPLRVRMVPVAVGAAAGAGGSVAAHRALDLIGRRRRVSPRLRSAVTAAAAVPAVVASLPVSRRWTRRHGYEPQPTGGLHPIVKVRNPHNLPALTTRGAPRRVHAPNPDTDGATAICHMDGAFGHGYGPFAEHPQEITCPACQRILARGVAKADTVYRGPDYLGRQVSGRQQRLRIYAAGGTPVLGPVAQVRQAGRYAPPGHRNSAMARQAAGGPGAATAGGVLGAYGGAELAHRSALVARHSHRLAQGAADLKARVLGRESKAVGNEVPRLLRPVAEHRMIRPLVGSKTRLIGAGVGYVAGKTIAGQIGGNVAISRNIAAQRRFDSHRMRSVPVAKLQQPLTDRQAHVLARRKRRSAVMSVIGGTAGLTALGLQVASRRPHLPASTTRQVLRHRDTALTVAAGVGGANALTNAEIQRREAKSIVKRRPLREPVLRTAAAWTTATSNLADRAERARRVIRVSAPVLRRMSYDASPLAQGTRLVLRKRANDPVRTSLTDDEAHRLVHGRGGYGLTGTLPSHLDRPERMRAYEARYLAAGGRKAEHWQRRARHAETSRNIGLAGATGAGAAWLAASSPRVRRAASPLSRLARVGNRVSEARVRHAAERTAVAAGTLGGASELYEEYARKRRGSYASAPAGVAASALRRMQSYSPS